MSNDIWRRLTSWANASSLEASSLEEEKKSRHERNLEMWKDVPKDINFGDFYWDSSGGGELQRDDFGKFAAAWLNMDPSEKAKLNWIVDWGRSK